MSLILSIDTSLDTASICLSSGEEELGIGKNPEQKDHASWLHPAIQTILTQHQLKPADLSAVAVSIGPGSYTGLRVGLSTAKGLCYALGVPLIAVGTLNMIAYSVKEMAEDLICPLIDARRMEVYMGLFDSYCNEIQAPSAAIITQQFLDSILAEHRVLFCGSGTAKLEQQLTHRHATFTTMEATASHLSRIALQHYLHQQFADLVTTSPLYVKEFFSTQQRLQ